MRKTMITCTILMMSAGILSAQEGDKKSQEILKETTELTQSYNSIKIEFTYSMENKEASISDSFDGTLLVKGNKYRLSFSGQTIISDGSTLWTYIKDANEVQINEISDDNSSFTPTKLLTSYPKDFKSKLIKEENVGGKLCWILDLVPVQGKSYYKVRLAIDKQKKQIVSLTIYEKNGSTFTYLVRKMTPNAPVDEKSFVFSNKDYPGVEVIDMR